MTRFRPESKTSREQWADPTALAEAQAPDERTFAMLVDALDRRRIRLDRLQEEIAETRAILSRFETDCQTRVGDLLAELRTVSAEAERARLRLRKLVALAGEVGDDVLEQLLEEINGRVGDDFDFSMFEELEPQPPFDLPGEGNVRQSEEPARLSQDPATRAILRRLYRDLAKRCHPDLSLDAADRNRRDALMQRVNEAFEAGDAEALRAMLLETESDDPAFAERPIAERLAWAREELARLDRQLDLLRRELTEVHVSDLYRLWRRYESGAPVFDDLESDLERRIRDEGRTLDRLVASYRAVVSDQRLDQEIESSA